MNPGGYSRDGKSVIEIMWLECSEHEKSNKDELRPCETFFVCFTYHQTLGDHSFDF